MRIERLAPWVALLGLMAVLVGCGTDAGEEEAAPPPEADAEEPDVPDEAEADDPPDGDTIAITVGSQQFLPALNLFIADRAGYFEEEGLDVTIEYIRGGPLISNAVQAGDVDIGGMNYDGVVLARDRGFDYKLLYPAVMYDAERPDVYLVVRSDAGIESVEDLAGHTIALRFGEIPEHAVTALLTEAGVDVNDVEFVEVPFPDMPGALETAQIDAAHIVEPFLSAVLDGGIAEILVPDLDIVGDRFLVNTWFATADWIEANPEAAERFVRALDRATQHILDDPDDVLPMAAAALETDEERLSTYFPERYVAATTVTAGELQDPIDFSHQWNVIDEQLDHGDFVSPYFPLAD